MSKHDSNICSKKYLCIPPKIFHHFQNTKSLGKNTRPILMNNKNKKKEIYSWTLVTPQQHKQNKNKIKSTNYMQKKTLNIKILRVRLKLYFFI